jgi:hypothetical protein
VVVGREARHNWSKGSSICSRVFGSNNNVVLLLVGASSWRDVWKIRQEHHVMSLLVVAEHQLRHRMRRAPPHQKRPVLRPFRWSLLLLWPAVARRVIQMQRIKMPQASAAIRPQQDGERHRRDCMWRYGTNHPVEEAATAAAFRNKG